MSLVLYLQLSANSSVMHTRGLYRPTSFSSVFNAIIIHARQRYIVTWVGCSTACFDGDGNDVDELFLARLHTVWGGAVLFCSLASVVVCRRRLLGSVTLHGGPVVLRSVRATSCLYSNSAELFIVDLLIKCGICK